MKKALFLAAAAGTLLVGFAPPPGPAMPGDEGVDYPPCSRTVRDRCIQMHERGVATPENLAINRGEAEPDRYAAGPDDSDMPPPGPYAVIDDELPPPPMGHHRGMHRGMHRGAPEMDSVVGAPPPPAAEAPVRYALNDYPACAEGVADRCVQRRVVVVHRERLLRIGERG